MRLFAFFCNLSPLSRSWLISWLIRCLSALEYIAPLLGTSYLLPFPLRCPQYVSASKIRTPAPREILPRLRPARLRAQGTATPALLLSSSLPLDCARTERRGHFRACRRHKQSVHIQRLPNALQRLLSVYRPFLVVPTFSASSTSVPPANPLSETAPLLDALTPASYGSTRFTYSLWSLSPFKGPPTPAVQDAWHEIMRCKPTPAFSAF